MVSDSHTEMKDSGIPWIGNIPESWTVCPIKSVSSILMGQSPDSDLVSDEGIVPFIQGKAEFGELSPEPIHYCDYAPKVCKSGDILMSVRAPVGFINLADQQYAIGRGLCAFTPLIDPNFFRLAMEKYSQDMAYYASGSTFEAVTMSDVRDFQIAIPPHYIQSKIAEDALKTCGIIDQYIKSVGQIIDSYRSLKQSIITEAITKGLDLSVPMKESGVDWIGNIPSDWNVDYLKANFKIKKDIAGQLGFDVLSVTQNGLKIKDIESNEGQLAMDYSKYQRVLPGDFVMNHMDLLTGFVDCSSYNGVTSPDYRVFVLVNGDVICHQYALRVFQVAYWNKIFYGMGQGVSTLGRWRLPREQFLKFMMPIPPMEEQKKIVSYIDEVCHNIDMKIQLLTDIEEKYREYKQSVIYEYVTGKTSVEVA